MTTILCGTDFSASADQAVDVAAALGRRGDAVLHLVHVGEAGGEAAVRLDEVADRVSAAGVRVAAETAPGIPDEVLVDRARHLRPGMVVLGAHGRRAPARWLLGSIAERVAQESPVPVFVVRESARLLRWLSGDGSLRVMVAVDRSESSRIALEGARALARFGPCEITAVHVAWLPGEFERYGLSGPMALDTVPAELLARLEPDLRAVIAPGERADAVRLMVRPGLGRPDVHLTAVAAEEGADLIVVGSHQRSGLDRWWHGSVARGVLVQAPTSVMVVPAPAP